MKVIKFFILMTLFSHGIDANACDYNVLKNHIVTEVSRYNREVSRVSNLRLAEGLNRYRMGGLEYIDFIASFSTAKGQSLVLNYTFDAKTCKEVDFYGATMKGSRF